MRTLQLIILFVAWIATAPYFAQQNEHVEKRNDKYSVSENISSDSMSQIFRQSSLQEISYLREIALDLSILVSDKDTPRDIVIKIRQRLEKAERYYGDVFSEEAFSKAKSAIRIPADAETFAKYYTIVKKVAGKAIIIVDK